MVFEQSAVSHVEEKDRKLRKYDCG